MDYKFTSDCIYIMIHRLIGYIMPVGECYRDKAALDNLKNYLNLYCSMFDDFTDVVNLKDYPAFTNMAIDEYKRITMVAVDNLLNLLGDEFKTELLNTIQTEDSVSVYGSDYNVPECI